MKCIDAREILYYHTKDGIVFNYEALTFQEVTVSMSDTP